MSSPSRQVIDPLICSYGDSADKKKPPQGALPPASRLLGTANQNSVSGWTPLISRTFSTDMISYNSTPSSKTLPSAYRAGSASGAPYAAEYDYPGLNLTPFLTHNLSLMNNQNSAGGLSNNVNFTPFCDKSVHLTDFFMDSPIRQTPLKVETITPSRFTILPESKPSSSMNLKAAALKRSITQIDTPARHPFKKADASFKDEAKDSDTDDEDKENDELALRNFHDNFVTPSKKKVLNETAGNLLNKTPLAVLDKSKFQTPAKAHPVSSPSTVIMSSTAKSPDADEKRYVPPSPTPNKDAVKFEAAEPIMGIFSEKKTKPKAEQPAGNKKALKKQLSGVTRFQIVFTDVHTLMNNKKKKGGAGDKTDKKLEKKKSQGKLGKQSPNLTHGSHLSPNPQHGLSTFQHTSSSLSASQDYNTSMNSSKEFSMLANNSTVNSTNSNFNTTEHTSFDLMHGGPMSTPGKYMLDHLFDRNSPNSMRQNQAAFQMSMQAKGVELQRQDAALVQGHMHRDYMPPPKTFTLQQAAQQALRHEQHQPPMHPNMLMSTPQHENVLQHTRNYTQEEMSPLNKESMALLYQHLQQYQHGNSPNMHMLNYGAPAQPLPQDMEVTQPKRGGRKKR